MSDPGGGLPGFGAWLGVSARDQCNGIPANAIVTQRHTVGTRRV